MHKERYSLILQKQNLRVQYKLKEFHSLWIIPSFQCMDKIYSIQNTKLEHILFDLRVIEPHVIPQIHFITGHIFFIIPHTLEDKTLIRDVS